MIRRAASLLLIVWALGFALFVVLLPQPLPPARSDAIVVLTGGPGRIERGLALMRRGLAKRMLVSGVAPAVKPHELALRTRAPLALFECCVDLGHEAVDTRSNGEETARWIEARGYRSVRLVTTDWHMPRAALELRHALPRDVTVVGDAVKSDPNFGMLLMEYNKFLVRRAAVLVGL
ncbi:uncharacterized SAM-binding protein YcdF (DUF218 family) [Sphingomonas zeicaulis]|uniref:YdcF family protein n=1 Tax=Sphingomonas zeicaulis TaxID=1632740 RepID=UPI003D25FC8A